MSSNKPFPLRLRPLAVIGVVAVGLTVIGALLFTHRKPKLLVLGDSISQMQMMPKFGAPLLKTFQQAGINYEVVGVGEYSNAIAGFTSRNLWSLMFSTPRPNADLVLVQAGTNDMFLQPREFPMNFKLLLEEARRRNPNALILCAPIPPIGHGHGDIGNANAVIRESVAAANDTRIVYIGDFKNNDWPKSRYQEDYTHPNIEGLAFISRRWVEAIKQHWVN